MTESHRAGRIIGIGVIGGWTLLLTWPLLFGGRVLYWGTLLLQFAPWRKLVAEALQAGQWPLWTQALGNGAPLLANHQSAVFYPPHFLFLLFPVERALGYSLALHVALAGLFAWLWARQLGLGSLGRLVTALAYAGSGFLVGHALFPSMVEAAAWLPLLFLLADRLAKHRRVGDALALGATLGVQFLAGHAQLWYYGLWAIGAYVLYTGCRTGKMGKDRLHVALLLGLAVVVAAGAAAVQMLPTGELAAHSHRADGADWDFAMTYSFWPWRLITLLAPDFFGHPADGDYSGYGHYWEDNGYLGLLPLLLAGLAVAGWLRRKTSPRDRAYIRRNEAIPFLLVMVAAALILALGENTPIYPLVFRYVPGFGGFQAPVRFLYLYTFAVATLAGIGADGFRLSYPTQYTSRLALAGGVALALLGWLANRHLPYLQPTFTRSAALFGGLLSLSAVTLLLRGRDADADPRVARSPLPRRWWPVAVVGLIAGDLFFFGHRLNPTADPALYNLTTASGDFLRAQAASGQPSRIFSFDRDIYDALFKGYTCDDDFGPTDLDYLCGLRETLLPNLTALEGLESANNYDSLLVTPYSDLLKAIEGSPFPTALRLLGLMNVRYIISHRALPDLTPVYSDGDIRIYVNPYALPRAWVVCRARALSDPDDSLAELLSPTFDPTVEVLLTAEDSSAPHSQPAMCNPQSSIRSLRYSSNQVTISAALSQPGYLILSQTFYPGWRVKIDGQPSQVWRANHAFCAVHLEAGEHQVAFTYQPLSFFAGLAVSGLTWAALIGWAILSRKRARQDQFQSQGEPSQ